MKSAPVFLKDYQAPAYFVPEIFLSFELKKDKTLLRSRMTVQRNPKSSSTRLVLNGSYFKLLSIRLDGQPVAPKRLRSTSETLEILDFPKQGILEIETELDPASNKALSGLYQSRGIYCTQCEAHGFRRMTYFPDRPDVMSRFTVEIIGDKKELPVLLSNGNCIEKNSLSGGRHRVLWQDPFPKPAYLFALVAGDLGWIQNSFVTRSGRKVDLRIYVEHGHEGRAKHAMRSLKQAMRWDEETFGLEYDLDLYMIVAVDDFNFGAMENKGLNIFNAQYVLADEITATDGNFEAIQGVIGHEYFHNWTGNRVTCRDWFQLTLKEGLTVFRDQEFSSDMTSRAVKRIQNVRFLKEVQFAEDAGPNAHPIQPKTYLEVNNFYTSTVYQKGAEVIRMIETLIGRKAFCRGTTRYFDLYDGQAVTVEEFVHAMEDASGADLSDFRRWYHTAGTPVLQVKGRYLSKDKVFELKIRQSNPKSPKTLPLVIPVRTALLDQRGKFIPLRIKGSKKRVGEQTLVVRKKEETFRFENVASRPVPSLLRGFSAPVKLETDLSLEDQLFILSHDTDFISRYEAAQSVASQMILRKVQTSSFEFSRAAHDAFGALLREAVKEPAFVAESLVPPSESFLNESLDLCRFDEVHEARKSWMRQMALRHQSLMIRLYDSFKSCGRYRIDPVSIGKRTLRSVLLRFIFLADPKLGTKLAWQHYQASTNMTETMASLAVLCDSESSERDQALRKFYAQWKSDPLVMNKWFALQAGAKRPKVLSRIIALEKDPLFDMTNPNKVRSLYGVFAGNLTAFHEISGSGYEFFADRILKLEKSNPGLAARLSGAFRSFSRLDPVRKKKMQKVLKIILQTPKLSNDTFEIISKTLKSD